MDVFYFPALASAACVDFPEFSAFQGLEHMTTVADNTNPANP